MSTVIVPPDVPAPTASPDQARLPYKFLDYFEERDEPDFAGRDRDIDEVLARIAQVRTFVLYGRSGLGKTSLLKAGIFPRLRERGDVPVYIRTLTAPLPDLLAALAAEAERLGVTAPADRNNVDHWIAALDEDGPVVLVLDQFEEFFIRFRGREFDAARAEYIATVARLVHDLALDLRIVFSLREDYLAELDQYGAALPGLFDNRYRLTALTAFGAREAIVRPLQRTGIPFSQTLVTRLLDLLREETFDPAILQIICTEVYNKARESRPGQDVRLTEDDLAQVGGLEGILKNFLRVVTDSLRDESGMGDQGLLLVRAILDTLVSRENTKQAVNLKQLTRSHFLAREDEIVKVLHVLEGRRLVRRDYRNGEPWYELIHERVVLPLQDWLKRDPEFFNFQVARDLIDNSSRGERWRTRPGILLNRGQIEGVVGPYRERLRLDGVQTEFLLLSAIFSQSKDVGYWAERHDREPHEVSARERVLTLLDPEADTPVRNKEDHDALRLGAVAAASLFPDPDGAILAAVERLGLDAPAYDASEETYQVIGRSLARLRRARTGTGDGARGVSNAGATPGPALRLSRAVQDGWRCVTGLVSFLAGFARSLGDAVTRTARLAREQGAITALRAFQIRADAATPQLRTAVLAAMVLEGDDLQGYPPHRRFFARRLANEMFRRANDRAIAAQQRFACFLGAFAGLVWEALVDFPWLLLKNSFDPEQYEGDLAHQIIKTAEPSVVILGVILGALLGWLMAGADAPEVLRGDGGFRPFRSFRSKLFALCMFVTVVFVVGDALETGGALDKHLAQLVMVPACLALFVAVMVGLEGAVTLTLRSTAPHAWLGPAPWAWLVSAFVSIGALMLVNQCGLLVNGEWSTRTPFLTFASGFFIYVVAVTRWYNMRSASPPLTTTAPPRRPSRRARAACVLGGLALLPLFALSWGFGALPWSVQPVTLSEHEPTSFSLTFGPATPNVRHVRLDSPRDLLFAVADRTVGEGGLFGPSAKATALPTAQHLIIREGDSRSSLPNGLVFVPQGTHQLDFYRPTLETQGRDREAGRLREARFRFTPLDFDARGEFTDTTQQPHVRYSRVVFREETAGVWSSTQSGTVGGGLSNAKNRVELAFYTFSPLPQKTNHPDEEALLTGTARIATREEPGDDTSVSPNPPGSISFEFRWNKPKRVTDISSRIRFQPAVGPNGEWKVTVRVESKDKPNTRPADMYVRIDTVSATSATIVLSSLEKAETAMSAGRFNEAIADYQEALKDAPDPARLHSRISRAFEKRGDLGSAISEAEQALKLQPRNAQYENQLAWMLCLAGRFEEALPHARKATEEEHNPIYLDTLAHAAYGTGHWAEAVKAWEARTPDGRATPFPADLNCGEDLRHYEDAKKRAAAARPAD